VSCCRIRILDQPGILDYLPLRKSTQGLCGVRVSRLGIYVWGGRVLRCGPKLFCEKGSGSLCCVDRLNPGTLHPALADLVTPSAGQRLRRAVRTFARFKVTCDLSANVVTFGLDLADASDELGAALSE